VVVALVVLQAIVLAVVVVLVVGLLRTHAEVLRRLHELGAGIYDAPGTGPAPVAAPTLRADLERRVAPGVAPPGDATRVPVADIVGVDPDGNALQVGVGGDDRLTLLAFLSSGCTTCAGFWQAFAAGAPLELAGGSRPRLVVVTKGPEQEHVAAVAAHPPAAGTLVMSSDAWTDYQVPASPYFVLVDGTLGVIGEGSAASFGQLAGLLERAATDLGIGAAGPAAAGVERAQDDGGRDNAARIDRDLLRAGITPGHRALYDWSDHRDREVGA
jgi:hypothetical protein